MIYIELDIKTCCEFKMNWILLVVFGTFICNCVDASVDAEYPGARVILTSKVLDYVSSLIIPSLDKELAELNIPDMSDDAETWIGTMHYGFSNIQFDALPMKSSMVSSSTEGITFQLSDIAVTFKCDWKYEIENFMLRFGDQGSVEINISNATTKLTALVTKSMDGHPVIETTNCEVNLPSVSADVQGSTNWRTWLYGWFKSVLESYLNNSLKSRICDYVYNTTTEWNSAISSHNLSKDINNFTICYGLLNDPVFSSNQIQFDLEGEVLTTMNDDIPLQSVVHALPTIENTDQMIHLMLTDKLFTTALTEAIHSGLLNYRITPDQLPSDSPLRLNTQFFKHTVPMLYKQFPNSPVALVIDNTKYKEIYLDLAGVHISLLGDLSLQVIQENETSFKAFSVELEVHCTVEAIISQPNDKPAILLEATDLQSTLGKLTSSLGDFETAALQRALNGVSLPLMFIVNEYGRKGFTVPSMDIVNFTHLSITLGKDYIQVSMDFEYLLNKTRSYL